MTYNSRRRHAVHVLKKVMTTTTSRSNSLSSLTGLFVSVPLALLATYGTVTPAQAGLVNILYRTSKATYVQKVSKATSKIYKVGKKIYKVSNSQQEKSK